MATMPDKLPSSAEIAAHQQALREDVNWVHQPAFDKTWSDLTGEPLDHQEWRREINWNFTADDVSFTQ